VGLAEDFDSLKRQWSSLSSLTKVGFTLSLILSFLSVASLADSLYKMKGFIAEGIRVWQILGKFATDFLGSLGLIVEQWQLDFISLALLVLVPYLSSRWKIFSPSRKATFVLILVLYALMPFVTPKNLAINSIYFVYFGILVGFFLPPQSPEFNIIGFRIMLPPILLAIFAAVVEGLSRPL